MLSLQTSTTSYFLLNYFDNLGFDKKTISIIFILISSTALIFSVFAPFLFQKWHIKKITLISLVTLVFFQLFWFFGLTPFFVVLSIILTSGLFSFILIGLDVLVEKNIVDENNTGRKRSLILTSSNMAFVVGPLISGVFVNYSINSIWLIGAIVFLFFSGSVMPFNSV